jgi:hypothetical protein
MVRITLDVVYTLVMLSKWAKKSSIYHKKISKLFTIETRVEWYFSVDVVEGASLVVHQRLVVAHDVETEAARWRVRVVHGSGEDLCVYVVAPFPDHLHCFGRKLVDFVLVVDAAQEQTVEAQLGEDRRHFATVSERVDLPTDFGAAALAKTVIQFPKIPQILLVLAEFLFYLKPHVIWSTIEW